MLAMEITRMRTPSGTLASYKTKNRKKNIPDVNLARVVRNGAVSLFA
jgi:hypothetical protein